MHESEKWKWSHSVMSDSYWPHGLQPTRLPCPWNFPGKSTGVGCHYGLNQIPYDYTVKVTNRSKGLDLIDRVPENYGRRFMTLYRRQWWRPSPRKGKAKWLSEEALQIALKRREVKRKGDKERYTHLNAEFQRIATRDKKTFLSDQCKEIEENNRIQKTSC